MTVSTPLAAHPVAHTPLVTHHTAPMDISLPHGVLRPGQANGTSASSSTRLPSHSTDTSLRFHDAAHEPHPRIAPRFVRSHTPLAPSPTRPISPSTPHILSTPHVARPVAPTPHVAGPIAFTPLATCHAATSDVSCPHIASRPERTNGTSPSSSTPLPSLSTDAPSNFHVVSHVVHPHHASRSERANGSFASSSTPSISHSTAHISSTHPPLARHIVPTDISHPHVATCPTQANGSFTSSSMSPTSHSTAPPTFPPSSPPRRKRSRRCFVCGGTGKHRLNPRCCPRTFELISKHLATFDANFRLVSFDGSPLPMTRHPGGVAAHLLSPRRLLPRTVRALSRSVSKSPGTFQSNPAHVHRAPHASPVPMPRSVPNAVPASNSNPPQFPCEERPSSPPFRILTPIRETLPRPETPSKSTRYPDNAFILLLLDCLTLSPSWRRELAGLIDAINRLNLDDDIPTLQKLMEPVRERYKTFVPSI
ncbi:hypothetical protein DFH08DRAFT_52458 [Mycena albidolilacea]|uniref:Uncharacterized protein n=1 Tax=Mycena albidolilacea TaxID=1033008 RepID=A0AAD7E9Y6_9AGAR|nr:hypothetical protein DFH08DRAFT_52458 [Mycena albidolilacea]